MTLKPIHVQIVYGSDDVGLVADHLLPGLGFSTERPVIAWCLNYHQETIKFDGPENVEVRFIDRVGDSPTGFGANHNHLFQSRGTSDDFVILNPDCLAMPGSIDRLLSRKLGRPNAAIIEGRQWPFEHPKEYDASTLETPWASGAFALISGDFFAECEGFDDAFFLYLEDVDLSWRAWFSGREVIYEPEAVVIHFSNGPFYRSDIRSNEEYYGSRNFLMLMRKFFGADGEKSGIRFVRRNFPAAIADQIIADYEVSYRDRVMLPRIVYTHPQVKVLGFNVFHEMRS